MGSVRSWRDRKVSRQDARLHVAHRPEERRPSLVVAVCWNCANGSVTPKAGRQRGREEKASQAIVCDECISPRVSRSVSPLGPPASCCLLIGNCRSPLPLPGSSHSPSFRNLLGCYDAPDTYTHLLIDETVTVWVYRSISIPRSELLCLLAWVGQPEIDIHPALPEQVDCRLDSG